MVQLLDKDFLLTIGETRLLISIPILISSSPKISGGWKCSETLLWQNATTLVGCPSFAPARQRYSTTFIKNDPFESFAYSVAADRTGIGNANNDLLYYYKKELLILEMNSWIRN